MTFDASRVAAYYDAYDQKLLLDYLLGNRRLEAAIRHALHSIPLSARRILDLGCGVGWSSREFARHFPNARITALDLSPRLIEVAQRLTLERNVRYATQNVLDDAWQPTETFDAIVMIDVYEHIPVAQRTQLHRALARSLTECGVLILTCPTPEHQSYLRQHRPDGLQPVDEDVDEAAAATVAGDVGGRVMKFERRQIWQPNDYAHIVIARPGPTVDDHARVAVELTPPADRARLVGQQLHLAALGNRFIAPIRSGPLECVATSELDGVSETAIRNHATALPMPVCIVHGRPLMRDEQDRPIFRRDGLPARIVRRVRRRFTQEADGSDSDLHRAQAAHLRRRGVAVVLAEGEMTALEMLNPCRLARVPLVVHFHCDNDYGHTVVSGARYRELFDYAHALVVLSGQMREHVLRLGAPPEKVHVIPYGVDIRLFSTARPATVPPRFLAVGRFVESQAPHLLVAAMSHAVRACTDVRLTMIGSGPLLAPCRQLARALHVDHAIEFTGTGGHDVVAQHMRQARAFVQHAIATAVGDRCVTPVSLVEAMVSGLPVISTRHPDIVECVTDGDTGLLVDEQDVDGMADRMIQLAGDPEKAADLGRAARIVARERFSLERSLRQLAAILRAATPASDTARHT